MATNGVYKCKICNNTLNNSELFVKEMMFGHRDEFEYFQCAECGCVQINNSPSNIGKYYPSNYYSFSTSQSKTIRDNFKETRSQYSVFGTGLFSHFVHYFYQDRILSSLRKSPINIDINSKILDVGCGSGEALIQLSKLGFKNLSGIDPYLSEDIFYGENLRIEKKTLDKVEGQYDTVMLHHVFEHVDNPQETLKQIKKILSPQGILIIRIPVSDSFAFKKYKANWVQLDAPRHTFLHTIKSMETLSSDLGFTIVKKYYDSSYFQFLGSEKYLQNKSLSDKRSPLQFILDISKRPFYILRANFLNNAQKGDQVVFYLKIE